MISTAAAEVGRTGNDTSLEDSVSDLLDSGGMEATIMSSSRGLVEIFNRSESIECVDQGLEGEMSRRIARFIHESVKDYFLKGGLRHLDESLSQNAMAISYERLAHWCYKYFKLALAGESLERDESDGHTYRIAAKCKSWPLLQYAVDNMLVYASKATEIGPRPRLYISESLVRFWLLIWEKGQGKGKRYPIHFDPCARCYMHYATKGSPAWYTPNSSAWSISQKRKEQLTWMRRVKDHRTSSVLHYT